MSVGDYKNVLEILEILYIISIILMALFIAQKIGRTIGDCIKRENSPTPLPCSQPSTPHLVVSKLTQTNNHYHNPHHHHHHHLPRKLCSPDTSGRHPELELSTTDSDTDSVGSLANHSKSFPNSVLIIFYHCLANLL